MKIKDKTERKRRRRLKPHVLIGGAGLHICKKGWWDVITNPKAHMKDGAELSR